MKKTYQKFLWISYITLFIVGFLVSVSVIVGTLFLLLSDEDLLLKGLMSTLSCVMFLYLCIQINEIMPPHWQEKKKELTEGRGLAREYGSLPHRQSSTSLQLEI